MSAIPLDAHLLSTELSTGVYMLFQDRELIYVGRSRNCAQRIAEHRWNGRPFDFSLVVPCAIEDAEWVERAVIRATEAAQNRVRYTGRPNTKRILQAVPPTAHEHPMTVLNKTAARKRAKACGLSAEFEAAVSAGMLSLRKKNPNAPMSNQCVIGLGELMAWCEQAQRTKFGDLLAA